MRRSSAWLQPRKWRMWQGLILLAIALPLWNEILSYGIATFFWRSLPQPETESLRILMVADPQIQGYYDEDPTYGDITRWDADRYLSKTYRLAKHHVEPDVVIFLGDLFDEGSKARPEDYEVYFDRFMNIFSINNDTKAIFIPGDNDIGGEGFDAREGFKVKRFEEFFGKTTEVKTVKFVDFVKLDFDLGVGVVGGILNRMSEQAKKCTAQYHILLNHFGVLSRYRQEFQPVIDTLKPTFMFTAHNHIASLYTCIDCREKPVFGHEGSMGGGRRRLETSEVFKFNLKHSKVTVNEIAVPTCSYRMGVPKMAYGAVVISTDDMLYYTSLWMPSRYFQLYSYLYIGITVAIILTVRLLLVIASYLISR